MGKSSTRSDELGKQGNEGKRQRNPCKETTDQAQAEIRGIGVRQTEIKQEGVETVEDHHAKPERERDSHRKSGPSLDSSPPYRCQLNDASRQSSIEARHACFKRELHPTQGIGMVESLNTDAREQSHQTPYWTMIASWKAWYDQIEQSDAYRQHERNQDQA